MSLLAIWMDRELAKIFQFSREKMERKNIRSHSLDHHTHRIENTDEQRWEQRFFDEVCKQLSPASAILILGPGVAKHHFQNYLNEHYPWLGRKVIGCETVDHPTDQQIAAAAKKIFDANSGQSA